MTKTNSPLSAGSTLSLVAGIKFNWSEASCEEGLTFKTFASANAKLAEWAPNAPKGGAYNKTNYTVTWANGSTYTGRFDLHHIDERQETESGRIDLAERILNSLMYVGDVNLTGEQADRRKRTSCITEEHKASALEMLSEVCFTDPVEAPKNDQADYIAWLAA